MHLGIRDDLDVVYAEKIHGHGGVDVPSRVGGRLPLTSTGLGKALLAYAEPDVLAAVIARPLRRLTPHALAEPGALIAELDEIRRTGIARDHAESAAALRASPHPRRSMAARWPRSVTMSAATTGRAAKFVPAVRAVSRAVGRAVR